MRREVRATANRLANFDDANLRRSARAAVAAGARVQRALEILAEEVPEHLAAAGRLRMEHKQASLEELGALADPPLTKDAVAGRIRRLLAMADKRAQDLGIPGTESKPQRGDGRRPRRLTAAAIVPRAGALTDPAPVCAWAPAILCVPLACALDLIMGRHEPGVCSPTVADDSRGVHETTERDRSSPPAHSCSADAGRRTRRPGADRRRHRPDADEVKVFRAEVTKEQIPLLLAAGQDGHELGEQAPEKGTATVEVYLTDKQAEQLRGPGRRAHRAQALGQGRAPRRRPPATASSARTAARAASRRRSSGPRRRTPASPRSSPSARRVKGQDILALKLTKGAKKTKDGAKPSVLYMSNQHAREWITPEMTRRLMHHYLDNYGKDQRITKIVDSHRAVVRALRQPRRLRLHASQRRRQPPVAQEPARQQRRRQDQPPATASTSTATSPTSGATTTRVRPPTPPSETYRGAGPGSEPETKALDAFEKRIGFDVRHQLPLRRRTAPLRRGLAGGHPDPGRRRSTRRSPAPRRTPRSPATTRRSPPSSTPPTARPTATRPTSTASMMFTPEMSTCQTASNVDPNDPWNARGLRVRSSPSRTTRS